MFRRLFQRFWCFIVGRAQPKRQGIRGEQPKPHGKFDSIIAEAEAEAAALVERNKNFHV